MKTFRSLFAPGDVGAFFGLFLDNAAQFVIFSGILVYAYGFPGDVVSNMIPGTAIGVLVGDLIYTYMAFRLAKRENRTDVTAMPLGLDTPSVFGITFGAIGPFFLHAKQTLDVNQSAQATWHMAAGLLILVGIFKLVVSFFGNWIRSHVPRSGLLGSIAAVAILLIAFIPAIELFESPIAGWSALIVILLALVAKVHLPFRIPGAVAAVGLGSIVYYVVTWATPGAPVAEITVNLSFRPLHFLPGILDGMRAAVPYLPIALPFALATVVGGIDVTESAAVAGDRYDTKKILLTEAIASLVAGIFGGAIQNTPYIGHPAYKSMGGRSGYTFATAILMGLGALFGFLDLFVQVVPKPAVAAILIFIGIEIMSQAFVATEKKHAPAVALCFLPPTAALITIMLGQAFGSLGRTAADLTGNFAHTYEAILLLGNGFVVSALLWGSTLSFLIDRKAGAAALCLLILGASSLFGIVHSPLENGSLFVPWHAPGSKPFILATAYGLAAVLALGISRPRHRLIANMNGP